MKKLTSLILTIAMVLSLMTSAAVVSAEGTTETLSVINFSGTTTYYSKVGAEGKLAGKFSVTNYSVDDETGASIPNTIDYKLDDYTGEVVYTSENPDVIASVNRDGSFTTVGYGYTVITATAYDKDNIAKAEGSVVITVFDSFNDGIDNDTNIKALAWAKDENGTQNFDPGNPYKIGDRDKSVSMMIDDGEYYWDSRGLSVLWNSYVKNTDPEDENHTVISPLQDKSPFCFYLSADASYSSVYSQWQTKERVTNLWFYDDMETLPNEILGLNAKYEQPVKQGMAISHNATNYQINKAQNYSNAFNDPDYLVTTDVKRSKGWHQVVLVTENAKYLDPSKNIHATFYIDGKVILETDICTEFLINSMYNVMALKPLKKTNNVTENVVTGTDTEGNPVYGEKTTTVTTYHTYFDELYSVEYKKPIKIDTMPENNAQNVPVETKFEINFGREVENTDGITVTCNGTAVERTITQNTGKVTVDCGILEKNADYAVTVGNTVTFKDGSQMPENLVFNYKTADGTSVTDSMGNKYSLVGSKFISFTDSDKTIEDYGMNYALDSEGFEAEISGGAATFTKKAVLSDGTSNGKENYVLLNYLDSIDPKATTDMPKAGSIDRYVIKYKTKMTADSRDWNLVRPIYGPFASFKHANVIASERLGYSNMCGHAIVGEGDNRRLRIANGKSIDLIHLKDMENWVEVCYIVDIDNWSKGNNTKVTLSVNDGPEDSVIPDVAAFRGNNPTYGIDRLGRIGMQFIKSAMNNDASISVKDFEIYALQKKCDYNNLTVTDTEGNELNSDTMSGQTVNVSLDVVNNNNLVPNQELTATVVIYNGYDEAKLVTAAKAVTTAELGKVTNVKVKDIAIPTPGEDDIYQMRIFIWDNYNNLVPLTDKISFK